MSTPKSNFPLRKRRFIAVLSALLLLALVGSTLASAAEVSLFGSFKQLIGLNAIETSISAPAQEQQQTGATTQPLVIGTCDTAGPIEVESTGGTTAPTAYATLKLAFDAINAGTHTGSINIEVCGNTTETASAVLNSGAVAPASYTDVTVRPVGGARIIEGSIVGGVIKLNGADNVTIDGRQGGAGTARDLTVRNNSTAAATAAIWLASVAAGNGAANNTVRNLEIAAGANMTASDNSTFGIIMNGTTISTTANGIDNDNNQFIANRIIKARYGIVTRGTTTDLNISPVVTDNIIGPVAFGTDQIGKTGIFMQADTGATVSRNIVQFVGCLDAQTCTGADRMGIAIGAESWSVTDTSTITSANYTVTKNMVHDVVEENTFSAVGIRLGTTQSGSPTGNLIANNFVYNVRADATSGDQTCGIGVAGGNGDRIVFNSLSLTGDVDPLASAASTTYGNAIRINGANGTNNANFVVQNNSIYLDLSSSSTAALRFYAITLSSNTYSFGTGGLNYNNYYINPANTQLRTGGLGTNTGSAITTEFATLANWKTALTPPQDANSIQADPQYVSPTSDLHITATSPNESAGTPIAGVTDDIDSQVRPNGPTPDIGADEIAPPATPGVLQFSNATYSGREGNTVTVTVSRSGGSVGTVTVDYATTGGTATGGASCGAGIDYVTTSGTLTFGDGVSSQTFNIQLCSDGVIEGTETIGLQLTNATGGATIGAQSTATVNIIDVETFNGAVSVGTGQTYTSLTNPGGLFEYLNNGNITGNVIINITSDLTAETGTVALNELAGGFTITIQPSGGARLISGSNANALLDFNGADNVTITGLTGTNNLTIRNTGTGAAVRFINDASNNTVTKTTLEAGSNSSVLFISTGITTGNDNITIDGNLIRDRTDAAGVPFNSINVIGTSTAVSNSNILINNNQILNFLQAGIVIGTSDNITFTFNDVFQSASRTTALFGVAVNSAAGTNLFSQNTIHDLTTTLATTGMAFNDARSTTVSRNNIFNFPSTTGSTGVLTGILSNGSSGNPASLTIVNNMVSIIPSFTNAQNIFGIRDFGFAGNTFSSYFNSVLISGTGSGTANTWACQRGFSAPTAYTMIDNICFNNRTGGTGNHFAAGDQSSNTGTFVSDYNIFVGTGATAANFFDKATSSTAVPVDFASWQAGPPTRDANSQASNPGGNYTVANMFVAPNDLHLNTTGTNPALNAGTPAGGVTNDFDGQTRPSGAAPEIGADEIVPVVVTNVQFSSATYTGAEGTSATITVTRTGDTTGASTVNFATSDGTATGGASCGAGVDYVTTSGTLNFAGGETSKTFNVTLCSDAVVKGDETVNLTLSSPSGATLGSPSTAVLTITNVNPTMPGTLALSSATYSVGEAGGTVTITVNRTGGTDGEVSASYSLTDGTATGGAACGGSVDYVNTGGTVTFAGGQSSQTFTVAICNDAAIEGNETFTVTLSSPTGGATIGSPSSATVTITDDDVAQPGVLALSSATYTVGEAAGTVTITVNRTGGTDGAVAVNYTLADGTATGGAACGGAVDYVNT
ncbi:MAG TPA: Calx-beta domain-containing protein, partial [Pyrinomonadaceae bacterium]